MCAGGGGGVTDGARMQLVGPDGQMLTPAQISVVSPPPSDDVPIAQQSIGPAGTAELQFLFFSPLQEPRGTAHLSFDQMRFAPTGGLESPEQIAPGPWTFDLPLG